MQRIATSLPYTELEVATGNYDTSRSPIDRIIIHTMIGSWQGAAARFDNPASQVSAHYGVKLDGGLIHWLEEFNTAYHAGDYPMNQRSIGIEHEDGWDGKSPEPTRPDALYTTSAKLVADICQFYNIPCDRQHILKHSEVSDKPTSCPDALDIDRIVREASQILPSQQPYADALQQCLTQHTVLVTLCDQKDKIIANQKQTIDNLTPLQDKVNNLEGQVSSLETANKQYQSDSAKDQTEIQSLLTKYQDRVDQDRQAIEDGIAAQTDLKNDILSRSSLATTLHCANDWKSIEQAVQVLQNEVTVAQKNTQAQGQFFTKYLQMFIDLFVKKKT